MTELADLAAANLQSVNARLAAEGHCFMHNPGTNIPARYLMELPIGNVIPLCVECCAWWRTSDAVRDGDPWAQPVRITELTP